VEEDKRPEHAYTNAELLRMRALAVISFEGPIIEWQLDGKTWRQYKIKMWNPYANEFHPEEDEMNHDSGKKETTEQLHDGATQLDYEKIDDESEGSTKAGEEETEDEDDMYFDAEQEDEDAENYKVEEHHTPESSDEWDAEIQNFTAKIQNFTASGLVLRFVGEWLAASITPDQGLLQNGLIPNIIDRWKELCCGDDGDNNDCDSKGGTDGSNDAQGLDRSDNGFGMDARPRPERPRRTRQRSSSP